MRLEFLFQQISHALTGTSNWDTRFALQVFFEILDLTAGRSEIKPELIKELDRQATALNRLGQSPGVNTRALNTVLEEISQTSRGVHELDNATLEDVRQNDFLNAVRQRSNIPGGTCIFDLPSLHCWLQHDHATRAQYISGWLAAFQPLLAAVQLVLRLIRSSAIPSKEIAVKGFFQKTLDSSAPSQMVRVTLTEQTVIFPEISGGRHRFSIRFMEQSNPRTRATQSIRDIPFQLACCVI